MGGHRFSSRIRRWHISLGRIFTQFIAILVAIQFAVIILKMKLKKGLMDGYEFDLIIFAAAIALAVLGSGAYSLENFLGLLIY